ANVTDPQVGWYAAGGFGKLRDPRAVGPLTQALTSGLQARDIKLLRTSGEALAKTGNEAALAALLNYAKSTNEPDYDILKNIATFEMDLATDFFVEQGRWSYLINRWQRPPVLRSPLRCRCIAG